MASVLRLPSICNASLTCSQAQFGNQIILYLSLGSSKIATILLIRRLFPRDMKMVWNVCNIIIGACTIWTVLAALLVSVGCSPANTAPVVASQTCPTIIPRYKIVVITDAIIEVILVATPAYLCWQLQMSVFFKLQVLAVFAFRLPLIVLACTFLTTWIDSLSSVNPGISRTVPTLLQQSELCLSIITATIPCVNGFLRSFDTGSGGKVGLGSSYDHGNNSHVSRRGTNQESYAMSSLKRSQNRESWKAGQSSGETGKMRARRLAASCVNTNNKDSSEFDQEAGLGTDDESRRSSRELIIRKDVQWEVISEDKRPESRPNVPGSLRLPK